MQRITKPFVQKILKKTDPQTHKGKQGHALLIGGSYGKMGSVTLASKAALHSGCGLVTAFIPECGYEIVQTAVPEVMVISDKESKHLSDIAFEIISQAIGIGPGIGQEQLVQKALHHFLQTVKAPLVVDADALNILSEHKEWLSLLPKNTILTPHSKELERLIGHFETPEETLQKATEFSLQHEIIIVMKGAPTKIIDGVNVYQNATGNAALATAGTGDVLTGIITGLLAQGYEPIQAAILGVYLHGLTADIALPKTGTHAFTASDIIKNLGKAYLSLEK